MYEVPIKFNAALEIWWNSHERIEWETDYSYPSTSRGTVRDRYLCDLFGCIDVSLFHTSWPYLIFETKEDMLHCMMKYPDIFEGCEIW